MLRAEITIVGGGPAGAAAAIRLARAGRAVVIIDRVPIARTPRLVTVAPAGRSLLSHLGLWERFLRQPPSPSPGVVSMWGSEEPIEYDHIFDADGCGWHVGRQQFHTLLHEGATDAGALILTEARVRSCVRSCRGWTFVVEGPGDAPHVLESRFLLEATGRGTAPVLRSEAGRRSYDRAVAVVADVRPRRPEADAEAARDMRILVEAVEAGWWYSAPTPDGGLLVTHVTDRDLLGPLPEVVRHWEGSMPPRTRRRLEDTGTCGPLAVVAANGFWRDAVAADGRLVAGDAAWSCDPLAGRGIVRALASGLAAGEAADAALSGSRTALPAFAERERSAFVSFLEQRRWIYGAERRWPTATFWRRRHEAVAVTSSTDKEKNG